MFPNLWWVHWRIIFHVKRNKFKGGDPSNLVLKRISIAMTHSLTSLEALQALHFASKELTFWIRNFRERFESSHTFIKEFLVDAVGAEGKKYFMLRTYPTDELFCDAVFSQLVHKPDQLTVPNKFILVASLKAMLKFDALFLFLQSNGVEENYSKFYRKQRTFVMNELKIFVSDLLSGIYFDPCAAIEYNMVVSLKPDNYKVLNGRFLEINRQKILQTTTNIDYDFTGMMKMEEAFSKTTSQTIH